MSTSFIISDMLAKSKARDLRDRYVTGYWTGLGLSESMSEAIQFPLLSEAVEAVESDSRAWYDPVIYEVEETDAGLEKVKFIDYRFPEVCDLHRP